MTDMTEGAGTMAADRAGESVMRDAGALAARAGVALSRLRERRPRVHCLTNHAAAGLTANVLLAMGARPSLTADPDELPDFIRQAQALLVNLGTLDAARRAAVKVALDEAAAAGIPWVLDPVMADMSRPRLRFAGACVARGPAAIRGNGAEMAALVAAHDSATSVNGYAALTGATVAATGALDHVTDGARSLRLANGHELMDRVTAMGCVASALLAAFLAVEEDRFVAAAACIAAFGVAGEMAAQNAAGPGSFQPFFIDALAAIGEAQLAERIVIA